jgi:hypothetical protein
MNERHDDHSDGQLRIVQELMEENASIDGDVLEISKDTWAIHGVFPYDGEVPIAVFDTYDEARQVLDEVRDTARPVGET